MQVGHDQQTSANCKSKLWFGQDKQLSTLVLKFNFIFSISSGSGRPNSIELLFLFSSSLNINGFSCRAEEYKTSTAASPIRWQQP
jgi:hypothetical protein